MFLIIVILIIIFILYYLINYFFKKNIEHYDIKEYQKIILNNDEKKLYKVAFGKNIEIYKEDCFQKCDKENCIKLIDRENLADKCLKCNAQENKCFKKSIIGGNCDDCTDVKMKDKIDCLDVNNFGCPNPKNIDYEKGVNPYYIQIPDDNINSPYNKKCVFCWNIKSEI